MEWTGVLIPIVNQVGCRTDLHLAMADSPMAIQTMRGIQQSLLLPVAPPQQIPLEPKGVVYTKHWVVELLLDFAGYVSSSNLVDVVAVEPAAGDGAFLGLMIERLVESCQRLGRDISECRGSIVAYELDTASAEKARNVATRILIDRGVERSTAEDLVKVWVRTGDYLFEAMTLEADFVIGNPPYVRLEDLPNQASMLYRDAYPTMSGRADLYVAFFEAALRQLREGGTCAFICADRWMRNQYGADLRELITSAFAVNVVIEMHRADPFHDQVDAYPAITIIKRQKQGPAIVASAGPEVESLSSKKLSATFLEGASGNVMILPGGLRAARVDTWFNGSAPWPCHSPEQLALLRRLEEEFPPLETSAKVGIGVATGNDKVFITKDVQLVESSRLLKLALVKDIIEGKLQWSGHYLIDPWSDEGLVELKEYPRLRAYFEEHAAELKKRHTAVKNHRGWYKTIDRVTHTLTQKPKLYIADIKNSLEPVLDSGGTYPHHNLYYVQSDCWDIEVLGGLLLSSIGQFFVESYGIRMRGGYLRFQAQYLRRIRVPLPEALTSRQKRDLQTAFRTRNKRHATNAALEIYKISAREMEEALEH
jgi:adenine-specific DNA-methyltransferase